MVNTTKKEIDVVKNQRAYKVIIRERADLVDWFERPKQVEFGSGGHIGSATRACWSHIDYTYYGRKVRDEPFDGANIGSTAVISGGNSFNAGTAAEALIIPIREGMNIETKIEGDLIMIDSNIDGKIAFASKNLKFERIK